MAKVRSAQRTRKRKPAPRWAGYSDADLLDVKLKDLKLSLEGTWLEANLAKVHRELAARGLQVRAHAWISDEWFSPPSTPGIAFPFYLAHPRLARLERKMMLEAEGDTQRECIQILRHEAGHVVQYAFGLHRRRRWQALFGHASAPYPEQYRPNPRSKNYVQHLRRWYAQCHPDEDFAETFAVWLTPRSNWRQRYANWPALKKLLYVDELMQELVGVRPAPVERVCVDPLSASRLTLRQHYDNKRERYAVDAPTIFDRDLTRIFAKDARGASAGAIIRANRAQIIRAVSRSTGDYPLALDVALDDMIARCRALNLRTPGSAQKVRREITAMLTSKAVYAHYASSRRQWFAV